MISAGAMSTLTDVVKEFGRASSTRALLDEAPEAIARLGFDRVLVSRIEAGTWFPETMSVRRDPRWATAILQAGREAPVNTDSVVEHDVAKSARCLIVDEVQTHPQVNKPIAAVSRSDNYGVVPLVVDRRVAGMVHVDCYFQQRPVREIETELLAVASECFAAHLTRLLLRDRLEDLWRPSGWLVLNESPGSPESSTTGAPGGAARLPLTTRELDVMHLLSTGRTNLQIGHALSVSEGTVRTHVSSILRKLDAANRAQAVSIWQSQN